MSFCPVGDHLHDLYVENTFRAKVGGKGKNVDRVRGERRQILCEHLADVTPQVFAPEMVFLYHDLVRALQIKESRVVQVWRELQIAQRISPLLR